MITNAHARAENNKYFFDDRNLPEQSKMYMLVHMTLLNVSPSFFQIC